MTRRINVWCLGLVVLAIGCEGSPVEPVTQSIDAQLRPLLARWGAVPIGPAPTQNPAVVSLGQALMFDKVLSGNRDISCATCHHPTTHAADGLSLSIGTGGTGLGPSRSLGAGRQFIPRNAPSLLDQGLRANYVFWDGRVSGFGSGPFTTPAKSALPAGLSNILAAQAMFPVVNRDEMRGNPGDVDVVGNPNELAQFADSQYAEIWKALMQRLLAIPEYVTRFNVAFPDIPTTALGTMGFPLAATAIAAFETQALTRTDSPFDRYLNRDDEALTPQAKRGALLFFGTKARCSSCHSGALLGGQSFASTGVPQLGPGTGPAAPLDWGRGGAPTVPSDSFSRFSFRIPPLRNVELTAPYMHDGVYPTLEAVVRHYNDVPTALRAYDVTQVAPELRGSYHGDAATINAQLARLDFRLRSSLGLTEDEKNDLVAFLKSLTDPSARDLGGLAPASVPSGIPVNE